MTKQSNYPAHDSLKEVLLNDLKDYLKIPTPAMHAIVEEYEALLTTQQQLEDMVKSLVEALKTARPRR